MKNMKAKKGFTVVELVIVIAVIAILSAVLIPTFSNLINKANESALQQNITNAYTEYVIDTEGGNIVAKNTVVIADKDSLTASNVKIYKFNTTKNSWEIATVTTSDYTVIAEDEEAKEFNKYYVFVPNA